MTVDNGDEDGHGDRHGGKDATTPTAWDCPRCGHSLTRKADRTVRHGRKPQVWWNCPACAWIGRTGPRDPSRVHAFHRPVDGEEDCVFCGEEDSNLASESFVFDGHVCEWVVCTACRRENVRRIGPVPG